MRVTVAVKSAHTHVCGEAVAAGFRAVGHEATVTHLKPDLPTQHVACWGWRNGAELRRRGHDVLVMERGYVGNRFEWYSLAWNGLNARGTFPALSDQGQRFRTHHGPLLKPWRPPGAGKYVLLAAQVPGDMSLRGQDLTGWYARMALAAQVAFNLPVRFREHPVAKSRGYNRSPNYTTPIEGTLEEALAGAEACITYNSNTGVDAVLAGVPTYSEDHGSMAWPVTSHRVATTVRPDRERWAADIAWKQWRLEEIASGAPFVNLEKP